MAKYKYKLSKLSEDSTVGASTSGFIPGMGENTAVPIGSKSNKPFKDNASAYYQAGYKKVKNTTENKKYKYKLKEANTDVDSFLQDIETNNPDNKKFIASRILGFDELETKLNQLIPLLQQAKHKTIDFYRQNPDTFNVLYGTDIANDYLNDLLELFTD